MLKQKNTLRPGLGLLESCEADVTERWGEPVDARGICYEYEIRSFPQMWGTTAMGFGGVGLNAMTTATTVVIIDRGSAHRAAVYFAGRHAYDVALNQNLMDAIERERLPAVKDKNTLLASELAPRLRMHQSMDNKDDISKTR